MSVVAPSPLFQDLPAEQPVWMSHGDSVLDAPAGFQRDGVQRTSAGGGHGRPEPVDSTGCSSTRKCATPGFGQDMLKNFLYRICDIAPTWTPVSIIEEAVERIRTQVGTGA